MNQRPPSHMNKPRAELEKARHAINKMAAATGSHQAGVLGRILGGSERTWFKTVNVLSKKPGYKNWMEFKSADGLRETDPLLSYLMYARGTDEHTVEEVTAAKRIIGIIPADGKMLRLNKLVLSKQGAVIGSPDPMTVTMTTRVRLLPVQT